MEKQCQNEGQKVSCLNLAGQDAPTTSKSRPIHKDRVAIKTSMLMIKT